MKSFTAKSSAVRWAKKAVGANWEACGSIEQTEDGTWYFQYAEIEAPEDYAAGEARLAESEKEDAEIAAAVDKVFEADIAEAKRIAQEGVTKRAVAYAQAEAEALERLAQAEFEKEEAVKENDAFAFIISIPNHYQPLIAEAASASAPAAKSAALAKPILRKSAIGSPCRVVWDIAEEMTGAKRKDIIAACTAAGIAFYTARTQYQKYTEALKGSN